MATAGQERSADCFGWRRACRSLVGQRFGAPPPPRGRDPSGASNRDGAVPPIGRDGRRVISEPPDLGEHRLSSEPRATAARLALSHAFPKRPNSASTSRSETPSSNQPARAKEPAPQPRRPRQTRPRRPAYRSRSSAPLPQPAQRKPPTPTATPPTNRPPPKSNAPVTAPADGLQAHAAARPSPHPTAAHLRNTRGAKIQPLDCTGGEGCLDRLEQSARHDGWVGRLPLRVPHLRRRRCAGSTAGRRDQPAAFPCGGLSR